MFTGYLCCGRQSLFFNLFVRVIGSIPAMLLVTYVEEGSLYMFFPLKKKGNQKYSSHVYWLPKLWKAVFFFSFFCKGNRKYFSHVTGYLCCER